MKSIKKKRQRYDRTNKILVTAMLLFLICTLMAGLILSTYSEDDPPYTQGSSNTVETTWDPFATETHSANTKEPPKTVTPPKTETPPQTVTPPETETPPETVTPPKTEEPPKTETPPETDTPIDYLASGGRLELPVKGATGYASIDMKAYRSPSDTSAVSFELKGGEGFEIIDEEGKWWLVGRNGKKGYVLHEYCFINLPDVIPSIVYNITNSVSSEFKSSYYDIPDITGKVLYENIAFNDRLGREEHIVPVLYSMAFKICAAQQTALRNGQTLIIYEAFRPYETQSLVADKLSKLMNKNAEVKAGITTKPWSITWFIAWGISNHQKGYAMDVSLGENVKIRTETVGDYIIKRVTSYAKCNMPTPMHELSMAAATFTEPVKSKIEGSWLNATFAPSMTESAKTLQKYCTDAGLSPLASEWWHFNDLDCVESADNSGNEGRYIITDIFSKAP